MSLYSNPCHHEAVTWAKSNFRVQLKKLSCIDTTFQTTCFILSGNVEIWICSLSAVQSTISNKSAYMSLTNQRGQYTAGVIATFFLYWWKCGAQLQSLWILSMFFDEAASKHYTHLLLGLLGPAPGDAILSDWWWTNYCGICQKRWGSTWK